MLKLAPLLVLILYGVLMYRFSAWRTARMLDAQSTELADPVLKRLTDQMARALDLPVKLHAEQLSDQGGAALVARHDGLSADHLEWLSPAGVAAMAAAGTVGVLLPGVFYFLRETRVPPVEALRAAGVPMAVATDCNPGAAR